MDEQKQGLEKDLTRELKKLECTVETMSYSGKPGSQHSHREPNTTHSSQNYWLFTITVVTYCEPFLTVSISYSNIRISPDGC